LEGVSRRGLESDGRWLAWRTYGCGWRGRLIVAGGSFLAGGEWQVNCRFGWAGSLAEDVSCCCRRRMFRSASCVSRIAWGVAVGAGGRNEETSSKYATGVRIK